MSLFWQIVLSNSIVALGLALLALSLERIPRQAALAHLAWVLVLLKLVTPPLLVCEWSAALPTRQSQGDGPTLRPQPSRSLGFGEFAGEPTLVVSGRSPAPSLSAVPRVGSRERVDTPWPWSLLVGALWGVVAAGVAIPALIRVVRFHHLVSRYPVAPGELQQVANDLAQRLGLRRTPEVRITPGILPPLVWSVGGPPVVVLPGWLLDPVRRDEARTVLAHELAHIQRGDHWVRILELIVTVVFPWHPVVWLATRRLRDLEETCCDAQVLELCPERPRAYALALVATLESLSGRRVPAVPLRTAIRSAHPLARRIAMLQQAPPRRLTPLTFALVLTLGAGPLALGFAQGALPSEPVSLTNSAPQRAEPAIVRGRVVDKAGAPIADARVRLAVPVADLRFANVTIGSPNFEPRPTYQEVRSDAEGHYEFRLSNLLGKTKASFDVLKPDFRRLVGTLMAGGDEKEVEIEPGRTVDASLILTESSRYYRGVVVDEAGRPIPDVEIAQYVQLAHNDGVGCGEVTSSRADGTFELFNVDLEAHHWHKAEGTSFAVFAHPNYTMGRIDDLHAIVAGEQETLRVVLRAGRTIGGTVRDEAGQLVAGALVAAEFTDGPNSHEKRKATRTDAAGRFTLRGLADGSADLKVHAFAIDQKARLPLPVKIKLPLPAASPEAQTIRLAPIGLPADLKTYDVLGLTLADVTPAVRTAYDLHHPGGVVIVDPGANHARLGLGELAEGYEFWCVGGGRLGDDRRVGHLSGGVREFVTRLVAESRNEDAQKIGVRVVYNFDNPTGSGSNTQYLKLTPDDLKELQALADHLAR